MKQPLEATFELSCSEKLYPRANEINLERNKLSVLFDCSINPIPSDANADFVSTVDGVQIRYAKWPALSANAKGTILVLQGRGEYIEKYFEVVDELRNRDYAVVTFDWRGQGRSQRLLSNPDKSHVESFDQFRLDFDVIFNEIVMKGCPSPFSILAHSTGGAVALSVAEKYQSNLKQIVLSAPFVDFGELGFPPWLIGTIATFYSTIGLGRVSTPSSGEQAYLGLPFGSNTLTSDLERYERYSKVLAEAPDLKVGPPTYAWVYAAHKALARFKQPDFSKSLQLPILFVTAGADQVVSSVAAKKLSEKISAAKHLKIDEAMHELLVENDGIRKQFWKAFDEFMTL